MEPGGKGAAAPNPNPNPNRERAPQEVLVHEDGHVTIRNFRLRPASVPSLEDLCIRCLADHADAVTPDALASLGEPLCLRFLAVIMQRQRLTPKLATAIIEAGVSA